MTTRRLRFLNIRYSTLQLALTSIRRTLRASVARSESPPRSCLIVDVGPPAATADICAPWSCWGPGTMCCWLTMCLGLVCLFVCLFVWITLLTLLCQAMFALFNARICTALPIVHPLANHPPVTYHRLSSYLYPTTTSLPLNCPSSSKCSFPPLRVRICLSHDYIYIVYTIGMVA